MRKKIFLNIFVSLCIVLLSSCTNGDPGSGELPGSTVNSEADISAPEEISLPGADEFTDPGMETEFTQIPPEMTETGSAQEDPHTDIPSDTAEGNASETAASETKTEAGTATEAPPAQSGTAASSSATASATAPKPPAEVVIPKINMPKSPGTNVISGGNAEVDYSNASEGYISAVYNGSKPAKIRIQCGSTQYNHDLASGGTREYFPLMGSGGYTVSVYEQASGSKYALLVSGDFDVTIKDSAGMYLYPNKYIDFDSNSKCVQKAAELCAGITDDLEKIAAIFTYTAENITYDKQLAATVQSGYVPHPDSTLSSKKGICFDYSSLFAAMCRSQGIPTRLVIGYAEPDIYHAWNEVYTAETGWITPELFLKKKGYNIADATFYASNSDKDKIAKYISDDGNYSAIYRY